LKIAANYYKNYKVLYFYIFLGVIIRFEIADLQAPLQWCHERAFARCNLFLQLKTRSRYVSCCIVVYLQKEV